MKFDVIGAVEACYTMINGDQAWIEGLLKSVAALDKGLGLSVTLYRIHADRTDIQHFADRDSWAPNALSEMKRAWLAISPAAHWDFVSGPPVQYVLERAARAGPSVLEMVASHLRRSHVKDAIWAAMAEPNRIRMSIVVPIEDRLPPRTAQQLLHFTAHLHSSMRLRCAISNACDAGDGPPTEAVLEPSGRVVDAIAGARTPEARLSLANGVRRIERARGALRRTDPDEALELWQGLVEGTWSLVDQCDSDGKRYVLARRNAPDVRDPKALTERERTVLAFAAMGHQDKYIGYLLGLAPSTISGHLRSAQRKLELASRADLIRRFAPLVQASEEQGCLTSRGPAASRGVSRSGGGVPKLGG